MERERSLLAGFEDRVRTVASLLGRGVLPASISLLEPEMLGACGKVVNHLGIILRSAALVMDESLLPCSKADAKAAVKACILACFLAGERESQKTLSALYCHLAHFQDIAWIGMLVFNGPEDLLDACGSSSETEMMAARCAWALHRVSSDLAANSQEMASLFESFKGLCEAMEFNSLAGSSALGAAEGSGPAQ